MLKGIINVIVSIYLTITPCSNSWNGEGLIELCIECDQIIEKLEEAKELSYWEKIDIADNKFDDFCEENGINRYDFIAFTTYTEEEGIMIRIEKR